MRRVTALLVGVLLCLFPSLQASAREDQTAEREAFSRLSQDSLEPLVAHRKPDAAVPFFVQGTRALSRFTIARAAEERGRDFFRKYGAVFGIRNQAAELVVKSVTPDSIGMTHVRYDQVHQGFRCSGASWSSISTSSRSPPSTGNSRTWQACRRRRKSRRRPPAISRSAS